MLFADDYLAAFENEDTIISLRPNFEILKKLDLRGIIVTALGNDVDYVSRFLPRNMASMKIRSVALPLRTRSLLAWEALE